MVVAWRSIAGRIIGDGRCKPLEGLLLAVSDVEGGGTRCFTNVSASVKSFVAYGGPSLSSGELESHVVAV